MAETFGSGISTKITDQLKARTKLFSERKDPKQLQVINSNSAWIKVRSSVNIAGDNSKAKQFILSNSGNKEGIGTNSTSLYKADNRLGFRPAPGITGFKVTSKNTYGTLQEADVNFNVWTLKDLEDAEKLFFRPGYSVLVEWGHSAYINNSNQIKFTNTSTILKGNEWFNSRKYLNIENDIKELRDIYDGNYEGFLGLIQNFSWSFRSDGGYDCSIKVVSKNVVLESITMPGGNKITGDGSTSNNGQQSQDFRRSVFHPYLNGIVGYGFNLKVDVANLAVDVTKRIPTPAGALLSLFDSSDPDQNTINVVEEDSRGKRIFNLYDALKDQFGEDTNLTEDIENYHVYRLRTDGKKSLRYSDFAISYIPLKMVLQIYNSFICLKSDKEKLVPFDLNSKEKYYTFSEHYTALPHEVIMMKKPSPPNSLYHIEEFTQHFKINGSSSDSDHKDNDPKELLNLYISSEVVLEEADKVTSGPTEEGVGFLEFIKGVLSRIEYALGEINQFDIILDQTNTSLKIIDRKQINPSVSPPIINLTGLGSTLVDLNISSAISSNIASQIAIAAQSPRNASKSNVASLLRWNRNLTDRHFFKKLQVEVEDQKVKKEVTYPPFTLNGQTLTPPTEQVISDKDREAVLKYADKLNDEKPLYELWNNIRENKDWSEDDFEDLANQNISNIQGLADKPFITKDNLPQGVVPVELSIKLLGIGGFKVGTTFKIEKGILPSKYNRFGYIITGVEQEIGSDNKWYTHIKTQFYAIK